MHQHIAPIQCKPWTLNGLPDRLIVSHYEDTYGNAVRTLNAVRSRLATLDLAAAPAYEIRELKREELAATGSVALHELYFGSLGGDGGVLFTGSGTGTKIAEPLSAALEQQFGSVAAWRREFVALAQALSGGSGWALLSYSRRDGRVHNQIAFDDSQAMLDTVPLLALDMYEHAYHLEFGANAVAYIEAFMRNIDWAAVARRFMEASADRSLSRGESPGETVPAISVEELAGRLAGGERIQVIDARPQFHFSRSSDMMQGAVYRDPELVDKWSKDLSPDTPVAVYCSYGFNVGCAVTAVLRERGFDARFVRGGLSAWYASGGERTHKSQEKA
ncbi:MAG TPA: Fe-Mn family superoxide dismutase [Methylomirabilota bacterium]|nr:Fe-Mn family superoxide dismutase [Methylomirabilota bacterium]